ncbi:MAG: tRNA pseudouridine(13) synthase TruD [Sandaracinaceae bacterium]|nr:tRNA pseudouridine(13) synthase TruD [Sandaracinaceae bacterium]
MTIDLAAAADTSALPYVTASRGEPIEAAFRDRPEDFVVDEIPAYAPCGEGDHLYVRFEKRELNTPDAVRRIAQALGVDPRAAGWAGLKDRKAITTQWASFERADPAKLDAPIDGVRVLESARHGNKLRTGHLEGNRFDLLLRGAPADRAEDLRATLAELEARGVPAYFGPQRFGRDGSNVGDAVRWLVGGGRPPRDRFKRKLLVSAFQSAMFNQLLAARIDEGTLETALLGDLLQKVGSGGLFGCEDPEVDSARARAFEITATGPMFGPKMRWPTADVLAREQETLRAFGVEPADLRGFGKAGPGTRRPYRLRLGAPEVEAGPDGVRVRFTLPAGAYATVVVRELLRREVS